MPFPCIPLHVRKADRLLSQMYERYFAKSGMRGTQFALLRAIAAMPEPFITEIGRILGMDQTTVTRNVEKLEKSGLVETGPKPGDTRKKMVRLSASGKARLAAAEPCWAEAQQALLDGLGEDEARELLRLLAKVSALAQESAEQG